jgi:tetratricopeptide (TPR) repeat protein
MLEAVNTRERPMSVSKDNTSGSRTRFWIVLLTLVHCFTWFVYYGQTPLGESPALDNRQTLLLAVQMANDELPSEPFHRAPLYPYLLSLFLSIGFPSDLLPLIARLLNAIALAVMAGTSASIAGRIWPNRAAPWIAGCLIGLNPILVFFSGDAFDILLATAAFTLALSQIANWLPQPNIKRSWWIGITLAIGAALRSHLLPLALLWPIAAGILSKRQRSYHLTLAALGPILGFVILGVVNQHVAGEFRMLPWQGAYNLWAGNSPEANGRIYAQVIRVDFENQYDNPAKLESIALYEADTGNVPPHSISEMNAHWQSKALDHISHHPLQWTALMFHKAYYFLNSYEQYDNKTYGFHKTLHPHLKFNPIHWGAILLLAVAGTLTGLHKPNRRRIMIALIVIFAAYAAGTILFYTSNRFRLPMLPLLAVLAAGTTALPSIWRATTAQWKGIFLLCLLATTGIAYSNFFDARNINTWEEDYALLANASLRTGRDSEAIEWASRALDMTPTRNDMRSVIVQARFNEWALADQPHLLDRNQARTLLEDAIVVSDQNKDLHPIVGIYHWKLGDSQAALDTWKRSAATEPFARLCLFWIGATPSPTEREMNLYGSHKDLNLLKEAIASKSAAEGHLIKQAFDNLFMPAINAHPKNDASN